MGLTTSADWPDACWVRCFVGPGRTVRVSRSQNRAAAWPHVARITVLCSFWPEWYPRKSWSLYKPSNPTSQNHAGVRVQGGGGGGGARGWLMLPPLRRRVRMDSMMEAIPAELPCSSAPTSATSSPAHRGTLRLTAAASLEARVREARCGRNQSLNQKTVLVSRAAHFRVQHCAAGRGLTTLCPRPFVRGHLRARLGTSVHHGATWGVGAA